MDDPTTAGSVRILAFSDLHRNEDAVDVIRRASAKADVVVGAGDFGTRGEGAAALVERFAGLGRPFVLVAGNHDRVSELSRLCADRPDVHLLERTSLMVAGIVFFGLGGEIPRRGDAPWNETMEEDDASLAFANAPSFDVLVTHTPPYGNCDLQRDGSREGSRAVGEAIDSHRPTLCLCGHIHHSWGSVERRGTTTVHNLGPEPRWHTFAGGRRDD